jgi:RNA recognition motif-containing protein
MEDVKEECGKYGKVLEIKIPRPTGGSRQSNGVGKIFVKFDTPESAGKALRSLAGRKFADRTVVTTYFSEVNAFYISLALFADIGGRKTSKSLLGRLQFTTLYLYQNIWICQHFNAKLKADLLQYLSVLLVIAELVGT